MDKEQKEWENASVKDIKKWNERITIGEHMDRFEEENECKIVRIVLIGNNDSVRLLIIENNEEVSYIG